MSSLARNRRLLACALGICGLALMLTMAVAVGPANPANESQAAPQPEATDTPHEAPTGFNNSTNGFEA